MIEGSVHDYGGTISTFVMSEEDANDLQTQINMRTEVEMLHEQMTCSRTGKILLEVAWCTKDMSVIFQKFPEVCSWDVTNGTNSERRELMIGCHYISNFKSSPHTFALIPNI